MGNFLLDCFFYKRAAAESAESAEPAEPASTPIHRPLRHPPPPPREPHDENQYLDLIRHIIENGSMEETRNGTTKSVFGYSMRFSLKDGILPILTTKKLAWKTCFHELMWFIRGSTDNRELLKKGVHIWDANASREFLDSRGLFNYEVNDLGPIYGHQWRHFNAPYLNSTTKYQGDGIDQLQQIIDCLKDPEKRTSRRLIMSAWNPCQLDEMALPPCHILTQFHVRHGKYLSCSLYQRSGDVGLGVPFNITSYCLLLSLIANHCDLIPDEFVYFLGNAHIYEGHVDVLREQIERTPFEFPKIHIKTKKPDISLYSINDIEFILPYKHHEPLKMEMVA
jgi:thymidylate synthase